MSARHPQKDAALLETLTAAYGENPVDLLDFIRGVSETIAQLEALFASIENALSPSSTRCEQARLLAGAGSRLADDFSGYVSNREYEMRNNLLAQGIDCGGAK